MKTYIAFLRGINVSGQKLIKMEVLRAVLTELPIEKITTYIQSGNIIFTSSLTNTSILENQIENCIEKHFDYQVSVIILSLEDLQKSIEQNPYKNEIIESPAQPYLTFLSIKPVISDIESLNSIDFEKDRFMIINKVIYILYLNPSGKTKLTNVVIERKLKAISTTRNWKTVNKLVGLMLNL